MRPWRSSAIPLLRVAASSYLLLREPPAALAFASPFLPPPLLSMPVWSLSSSTSSLPRDDDLPATSMNIVTFCSAVSVAAPKLWAVSLYDDTLTKDSFLASGRGVLQLLRPSQKALVPILGKRSGYEVGYSKRGACSWLRYDWVEAASISSYDDDDGDEYYETVELIPDCATYIHLKVISSTPAGDHLVTLCEVVQTSQWDKATRRIIPCLTSAASILDPSDVLYTGQLRQEGII